MTCRKVERLAEFFGAPPEITMTCRKVERLAEFFGAAS
jgi:hypothetical protein